MKKFPYQESDRNHNKKSFELFTLKIYTDTIRVVSKEFILKKKITELVVEKNKSFPSLLLVFI